MKGPRAMTEKEKKLFAIFRSAIQAERSAQAMYQEAVDLCEEPMLKAVLKGLRDEEVRHEKEVLARYHQFKQDYGMDGK
jgi:rubrerythrin